MAPTKSTATADILERLRERAKAERPAFEHEVAGVGTFGFRRITGEELEEVAKLAGGFGAEFRQFLVNKSSVEPKIGAEMWDLLGKLTPATARGLLVAKVMKENGLAEDALEAATKSV